jgi:hypothetical protein
MKYPRVKISNLRLAEVIRGLYRDHEARGLPRPHLDQIIAAAGFPPGQGLWRTRPLVRAMRDAGELPDLPRADRRDRAPTADRAAVAATARLEAEAKARARARLADPPPDPPPDPWGDLVREHDARWRRILRWLHDHEEVPCRCD